MTIDHKYLDEQLASLDKQAKQAVAQLNAIDGARQVMRAMKQRLDAVDSDLPHAEGKPLYAPEAGAGDDSETAGATRPA